MRSEEMNYFLRFTNEPETDLQRGYSWYKTDKPSIDFPPIDQTENWNDPEVERDFSALCSDPEHLEVLQDGTVAFILEGLCGYALEAETLEAALQEAQTRNLRAALQEAGLEWADSRAVIFSGYEIADGYEDFDGCEREYIETGEIFEPTKIEWAGDLEEEEGTLEEDTLEEDPEKEEDTLEEDPEEEVMVQAQNGTYYMEKRKNLPYWKNRN
jgi:hypothetical protein